MKKNLKLSFMAMLAFILVLLTACGSSESSTADKGTSSSDEAEKKTIKVVTNAAYAPMEYLEGDKIVGFDVDFVRAVIEEAGYEMDLVNTGWDGIFVEVEGETAQVGLGSITINEERQESYDFSVPYYLSTIKILVPEGSDIKSAEDLKGKVVAVQNGTTGQAAAESVLGKDYRDMKKFEDNNLAIQELLSGGAEAVLADNTIVEEYAKNNLEKNLTVVEDAEAFDAEFYGLLLPKGSELKPEIDAAINAIFDNGKYTEIYKEWFGNEPNVEKLKEQQ
ncbi:transporter substrate-binding domain-containing protein [Bacillus dakarensis]|uniref:transporter substrate-binding domain-containing protein n=1 Tax=Robertmurraya dakarensis TaxID=1926278 RepID=UPI000980BEF0|nr:transporter substrate-binding domain-containing protein [Bacillus dakarensis]